MTTITTNAKFRVFFAVMTVVACAATGCPGGVPEPGGDLASTISSTSTSGSASGGDVLLEQLSLERINRARLRPGGEAARFGIAIDEGIPGELNTRPKPPVAANATLRSTALAHARDMTVRGYFEHVSPEGVTPFDRIRDGGYDYLTAAENLAWRGSTGTLEAVSTVENQHQDLFVDAGIVGRGHRTTMLNENLREVGIAVVRGTFERSDGTVFTDSFMQTQDFGTRIETGVFVLGAVYNDTNGNGGYDHGEGVSGASVELGGVSKTTNEAGGYSFEVSAAGTFRLDFGGGNFSTVTTDEDGPNIKVDFIDGNTVEVNLGVGAL